MERWLVALWLTVSAAASAPASWEILVPSTATADEIYAATELSEQLGNVTGTAVLLSANRPMSCVYCLSVCLCLSLSLSLSVSLSRRVSDSSDTEAHGLSRSPSLVRKVARPR